MLSHTDARFNWHDVHALILGRAQTGISRIFELSQASPEYALFTTSRLLAKAAERLRR
jgi:hypothetical protein